MRQIMLKLFSIKFVYINISIHELRESRYESLLLLIGSRYQMEFLLFLVEFTYRR